MRIKLRIALFKGNGFFGTLVKKWTRSKYSHVELLLPNGNMCGSVPNIGVRTTKEWNEKEYDFYDIEIDQHQLKTIEDFCVNENGCKYDWTGIFLTQFVSLNRESEDKWFCSEFVISILTKIKIFPETGLKSSRFSPDDVNNFMETYKRGANNAKMGR